MKLLGTVFIISHTFQCEHYFYFACPVKFDKVGDFAGHIYIYNWGRGSEKGRAYFQQGIACN